MSRPRPVLVGLVLCATALCLAACGGSPQALRPGSYQHATSPPAPRRPPAAGRGATSTVRPSTAPATGTPAPTTTAPSYLHPPPGQPWTVRGSAPWVAAQWISAMNTVSWTWTTPAQYLYDARAYMTPAYYHLLDGYEQKAIRDGGAPGDNAYWHEQKARHDGVYAEIDFAYTITEAGVTPTSQAVRVAFWYGQVIGGVTEPVNTEHVATIEDLSMERLHGRWAVAGVQPPAG